MAILLYFQSSTPLYYTTILRWHHTTTEQFYDTHLNASPLCYGVTIYFALRHGTKVLPNNAQHHAVRHDTARRSMVLLQQVSTARLHCKSTTQLLYCRTVVITARPLKRFTAAQLFYYNPLYDALLYHDRATVLLYYCTDVLQLIDYAMFLYESATVLPYC